MKAPTFPAILILAAALALAPLLHAQTLNFDDLPPSGQQSDYFTLPYQFLSFGNLDPATNDWGWNSQNPFPYTPASGNTAVATDAELYSNLPNNESSKVTSATPFLLTGAYFAGFPLDAFNDPAFVQFRLYNGASLVWTSGAMGVDGTAKFLATNYANPITAFSVVGSQGYWVMDDLVLLKMENDG